MSIIEERRGPVVIVTLNRPAVLNALDDETFDELLVVWEKVAASDVGAVVLTGAGRSFSAGADLSAPMRSPEELGENQRIRFNANVLAMAQLSCPIVAAVNGHAIGAGLGLACIADVRIGSEHAVFKPAFSSIGAVPDAGTSWSVPRLIGAGRAFDWFCSNRSCDAAQALAWGLVNEIVPAEELLVTAEARARELAALPQLAVALTKQLLGSKSSPNLADQLEREVAAQQRAAADPARAEARARAARGRHSG